MGGTNFFKAMEKFIKTLNRFKKTKRKNKVFSIFLSDGEADNPKKYFKDIKMLLETLDSPLLSVAISNQVDPTIMVQISLLNGELGLCLIKDSEKKE